MSKVIKKGFFADTHTKFDKTNEEIKCENAHILVTAHGHKNH